MNALLSFVFFFFFFLAKCGENLVFVGWVAPEDVTHHVSVLRLG